MKVIVNKTGQAPFGYKCLNLFIMVIFFWILAIWQHTLTQKAAHTTPHRVLLVSRLLQLGTVIPTLFAIFNHNHITLCTCTFQRQLRTYFFHIACTITIGHSPCNTFRVPTNVYSFIILFISTWDYQRRRLLSAYTVYSVYTVVYTLYSVYTVLCTLYRVYTVVCTMYGVYTVVCTLYNVYTVVCTLYKCVHCNVYTTQCVHCSVYTVHCVHCSVYTV